MVSKKSKWMFAAAAVLALGICTSSTLASEIVALSNNTVDDVSLSASLGNAVWQAKDPNGGDWEIFLYSRDSNEVIQLTDNDVNDVSPVIAGAYAAWEAWDGNDWEICVYNGDKVTQITNNDVNDISPKLSQPFVFWQVWDGNDWEINKTALPRLPIKIECKITPQSLNLKSKGNWVDIMLFLPNNIRPSDIKPGTILLEDQLSPVKVMAYDKSRTVHMKFSRSELQAILQPGAHVKLDITAYLNDGTKMMTSDTIKVIH